VTMIRLLTMWKDSSNVTDITDVTDVVY
jgi:hypothetical protein